MLPYRTTQLCIQFSEESSINYKEHKQEGNIAENYKPGCIAEGVSKHRTQADNTLFNKKF